MDQHDRTDTTENWLTDPAACEKVAMEDEDVECRCLAVKHLTNQKAIASIARWDYDPAVRAAAEARLTDKEAIRQLKRRRETHPDISADIFKQKEAADIGSAAREVQFPGQDSIFCQDSIFYSSSYLCDCNLAADIYCYCNGGSEYDPEEDITAYLGSDMDEELWRFTARGIGDVAIDRRAKYAAVASHDGVFIVEAHPKKYLSYPYNEPLISPVDWPVLHLFEHVGDAELAFSRDHLLYVSSPAGAEMFTMVLDIDRRLAWDAGYVFYDAMRNPESGMERMENSAAPELRFLAAHTITDQAKLIRMLKNDRNEYVRRAAAFHVDDMADLSAAAVSDEEISVRQAAASRLSDQALLARIAQEDAYETVREAAEKRLRELRDA